MIKVTKAALPPPVLRQAYLESLAEPQELYLEEQVNFTVQEQRVIRAADDSDVEEVWRFNDDFFISRKEVQSYVASNSLFLLLEKGEVVGCGIGTRVIESKDDIDIGMLERDLCHEALIAIFVYLSART